MVDPRAPAKPTLDERVQLETVDHKARTAAGFGAFVASLLWLAFWGTGASRRWLPAVFLGVAAAVALYEALR